MKRGLLIFFIVLVKASDAFAQGTTCTNAITIPLDGNCYTYNTSTTTGGSAHCTGSGFGGNGRVTYFRFTTNSTPDCVLLDMQTSVAGESIEAVLFTDCSGGVATGGDAYQSLCIDDGDGIWATNLWWSNLAPNTTYYLRVRTEQGFTGTIQICGKYTTPSNNLCSGAIAIDEGLSTVNNGCNEPSAEVTPASLCAGSLENTSWYSYTVLTTGTTSLIISAMNCHNANFAGNNDYGIQTGFFTGTCGSLTSIGCIAQTGTAGGTLIATTPSLSAGTVIYVAIDGYAGSNCEYSIQAINSVTLPVKLNFFEGWKNPQFNLLTWVTLSEINNQYFEIERSEEGINFSSLGRVAGALNSNVEKSYSFKDENPFRVSYYRLKQIDIHGSISYSRIIRIVREYDIITLRIKFQNPSPSMMKLNIEAPSNAKAQIQVVDALGRILIAEQTSFQKGFNQHLLNLSRFSNGNYYLIVSQGNQRKSFPFIKN